MRAAAAVALALAAAGCGDDGSSSAPVDAAARPTMFGGARPVTLQVPGDFDPAKKYPLVLILHGYSVNGYIQQLYFHMDALADSQDVLVLAPDGTLDGNNARFWNADPACCDLGHTGVDDVAYLGGLIDDVMASWPVDPARVVVVGHSNGAFMAYRLACDRADVISAIAGLAGHANSTGTTCAPAKKVSVLHLHGTADEEVPYGSGDFGGVMSPGAIESVQLWATRDACSGVLTDAGRKDLDTTLAGAETQVQVTGGCPAGVAADLWTIEQGTHIPQLAQTFPAELMTWFAAHPRS